jgi:hypothetical protein
MRRPSDPPLDNDRELTTAAVANLAGARFQTLPPVGGFSQTAANDRARARTQTAQLVTAALAGGPNRTASTPRTVSRRSPGMRVALETRTLLQ